MSGDYVSRDYLLGEYDRQHQGPPGGARKIIAEAPASDVKPVIRAHWYVDDGCAYCSNCRNNFKKAILKEAKYCPKCGAQIIGYGGHPDAGPPTPYDLLYEEGGAGTT